ncbi:MAG: cyanophycinase [Roseivirga sp.]|jgi:cyanophycinase
MEEVRGTLIPIGGNEDKGKSEINGLDFISEGILSHVVNESGGVNAKIIVVPTASSIPRKVGLIYTEAFDKLGCTNVTVAKIKRSEQCEDPKMLALFEDADCVMFSGGDQSRIASIIGETSLHALLAKKFKTENFVIAGTSAGAMAMAHEMIAGGSSTDALLKGAVKMTRGLGLMPKLVIDTHFIKRGRFGRLAEAVAIFPDLIGIGLAEDTGIVIKNGDNFKVIGSGMVIVLDASQLTHNAHSQLKVGTAMSMSNLTTHILANGDRFTLHNKMISVLPIKEKFV